MIQNEIKLLKLLREKSLMYTEAAGILNVSNDLLMKYLNNLFLNGYDIQRQYYSDGNIRLALSKVLDDKKGRGKEDKKVPIVTSPDNDEFRAVIISDLHFGCSKERLDLVKTVFEYASYNEIHTIFGCGDMIDGDPNHSAGKSKILDVQEQIEYFIEKFPRDDEILTFTVLGNHEELASKMNAVDIRRAINNNRKDIIVGNFDGFEIPIKNEIIRLEHEALEKFKNGRINIFGHAHKYKLILNSDANDMKERFLTVSCPALSDVNQGRPAFLEMNLTFEKGKIETAIFSEIGFNNENVEEADKFSFLFLCKKGTIYFFSCV